MCTGSIRQGGGALEDIVSITPLGEPRHKITVASLREKKLQHQPITCLTAYDYASARLVDEANIDILLVGDSLAMTMLGYPDTLSVTVDEMLHHTKAVRRGVKHALLVADMPYGSYHVGADDALRNATRFVKEAGAEVVKIEGGEKRADLIRRDRRRNSCGWPHRPHSAVRKCHGWIQSSGQVASRDRTTYARCRRS